MNNQYDEIVTVNKYVQSVNRKRVEHYKDCTFKNSSFMKVIYDHVLESIFKRGKTGTV